ncbi:jerky protein homolog-like [Anastrepha ludens]|uniref:jerky protein homolog-like n=1 Tax=Anastrepha ludens TaxID=28586 RepID=UPI0023B1F867|nr:jerky protein homolog-like [Anastrepha ludens]
MSASKQKRLSLEEKVKIFNRLDAGVTASRVAFDFDKKESEFNASDGWLTKFKRRFGMRFLKVCGEILSSDTTSITPFINSLRAKMNEMNVTNQQLYNADESGLFYRLLPDKTYVAACEKTAPGRKIQKQRITFMLCSNADGSNKIKPLVIGKAAKPRCFNNFQNPLNYDHSANAWMTKKIFSNWFHNEFVKEVRRFSAENNIPPKAILLLDNCSAHSPIDSFCSDDGNIVAMSLPPNVTAVIQPMDQNPIKIAKLKYRNMLLSNIVAQEDASVHDMLKRHSIRDAILMLKSAWNDLPQTVLEKAWNQILNWDDDQFDKEDDLPLSELLSNLDYEREIEDTRQLLLKLGVGTSLSTDEIEGWNADMIDEGDLNDIDIEEMESDEDIADGEAVCSNQPIPYLDAISAVNTLIKWNEQNVECTNKHMANLFELRSDIVKKQLSKPQKQCILTDYFTRSNT